MKAIQDLMRKDAGLDGDAQRLAELVWMLFLKVLDAREEEKEAADASYRSLLPEPLRFRAWAGDSSAYAGDALLVFVQEQLFPALRTLEAPREQAERAALVRGVFANLRSQMKSGALMRQVLGKLVEMPLSRSGDRHQVGDLYERLLADLQNAGNAGEYYTPRALTKWIVERLNPRLGETILDPACGTGGFLVSAAEHLQAQARTKEEHALIAASLHGVEKKPLPHLLCVTNLILHGVDVPLRVTQDNLLRRPLHSFGPQDQVDIILTNPPFGGFEEDGVEEGFPPAFRTKETADLFLLLMLTLLREGGRAAIVVPDGMLFGEGTKARIKEKLLREANLYTILRLPRGVFHPYTSIKTNVLFLEKGKPTEAVWVYEHPYPAETKRYSRTRPLRVEELEAATRLWEDREETARAFCVPIERIVASGYNLDWRHPGAKSAAAGADLDALWEEVRALSAEARETRERLRAELLAALDCKTS